MYFFCLTSLTPRSQEKWFLHQARILLILYKAVNPFEVIGAPIQVSGIVGLTVDFTLNDCNFHIFFLFLKCLLASRVTSFRLSTLLCFASCSYCIVACFLWLKNRDHSSPNQGFCCFNSHRHRLSLAEGLIFSLMFSQALFMSLLSFRFSKASNLLEISI